mmetsp:Transcript_21416/g.47482  ORF Transcript_21416/g.47482 Transcript_21416/m.47482 type:complete len:208 (-) Transcript_21416:205-828(-)|eukprot:CAMPEP_0170620078 /NCGR_PEP_ID=MMETSP0224-20130122/27866_1 /TAXON_ID=285029 /ORGANISM="Togula jolla, Strain CCCM 725" /LENGTH=207 /DNA_ID=CAMNT_0010946227 /DNA_START=54 /DNA_END=677 /DNA_ORIENTATION=-
MAGQGMGLTQVLPLVVTLGLSKVDLVALGYTRHFEVAYVVVQLGCLVMLGLLYKKIEAMTDDGVKIKVPEVKQMGQVVTPATEQTAKEHDMAKWMAQAKQIVLGACILGGIYYKWQTLFPLVLQVLMTPMQLIESPLFKVHFFGSDIPRPFKEPNPFGLPEAPEAPEASAKAEEVKDKKEDKEGREDNDEDTDAPAAPKKDEDKKEE